MPMRDRARRRSSSPAARATFMRAAVAASSRTPRGPRTSRLGAARPSDAKRSPADRPSVDARTARPRCAAASCSGRRAPSAIARTYVPELTRRSSARDAVRRTRRRRARRPASAAAASRRRRRAGASCRRARRRSSPPRRPGSAARSRRGGPSSRCLELVRGRRLDAARRPRPPDRRSTVARVEVDVGEVALVEPDEARRQLGRRARDSTSSSPVANGSSVPACPVRAPVRPRGRRRRRERRRPRRLVDEDEPAGLKRPRRHARGELAADELGDLLDRARRSRSPAACRWPPPPRLRARSRRRRARRSRRAGRSAAAGPSRRGRLADQRHQLGALDRAQVVDDPLGVRLGRADLGEVARAAGTRRRAGRPRSTCARSSARASSFSFANSTDS